MGRRIRDLRKSNLNRTQPYYKFLKPGALALLRDSRVSARSLSLLSHSQIYVHRHSPRPASPTPDVSDAFGAMAEGFPFSAPMMAYGPRFPQRKKLLAAKSVLTHRPSSPTVLPADSAVEVFGSDAEASH